MHHKLNFYVFAHLELYSVLYIYQISEFSCYIPNIEVKAVNRKPTLKVQYWNDTDSAPSI